MTDPERIGPPDEPESPEGIALPSWVDDAIAKSRDGDDASPIEPTAKESGPFVQSGYEDWAGARDETSDEQATGAGDLGPPSYEASPFEHAPVAEEPYEPRFGSEPVAASDETDRNDVFEQNEPFERASEGESFGEDTGFEWAPATESAEQEAAAEQAPHPPFGEEADFERAPAAMPSNEAFPSFLRGAASRRQPSELFGASEDAEPTPFVQHDSPLAFAQEPATPEYDEYDLQRAEIVAQALAEPSPTPADPLPLPTAPTRRRGAAGPWVMAAAFFAAAALVLAVLMWLRPISR